MTERRRNSAGPVAAGIGIICCGAFLAWQATRVAAGHLVPAGSAAVPALGAPGPEASLDRVMMRFTANRGALSDADYDAVAAAAAAAPLDARPFLFVAVRSLVANEPEAALRQLEAGRRLDPRQRWIRLLLLDRYLRLSRYNEAATELAVLSRLVSGANPVIVTELSRLATAPATRPAVRRTLAGDPDLEQQLLANLARNGADPVLILDLASPAARRAAGRPGGWGAALVQAMVERGDFARARDVWQSIYGVPAAAAEAPIYDAAFERLAGAPPFNWSATVSADAAVEIRRGQLQVDYYGRRSTPLLSQIVRLPAGRGRLGFTVTGSAGTQSPRLTWTIACARPAAVPAPSAFATILIRFTAGRDQRIAAPVDVPSDCPFQRLQLAGEAGEFPTPVTFTVQAITFDRTASR